MSPEYLLPHLIPRIAGEGEVRVMLCEVTLRNINPTRVYTTPIELVSQRFDQLSAGRQPVATSLYS